MYSFAITIFERVNFKYIIYGEKEFIPSETEKQKVKQT